MSTTPTTPPTPPTTKRRGIHIPIISLFPDFFAALPAMLLILLGFVNCSSDAALDLFGWKLTLPIGLPIIIGVLVGWGTGIYCGWTLRRNVLNQRVRIARGKGELDAVFASPQVRAQVEAIVGPPPL